jgi:hypothetical protein
MERRASRAMAIIDGHRVLLEFDVFTDATSPRGDVDGVDPSGQKGSSSAFASCARTESSLSPSYRGVAAELERSGVVSDDSWLSSDSLLDDAEDCGAFPGFDMARVVRR